MPSAPTGSWRRRRSPQRLPARRRSRFALPTWMAVLPNRTQPWQTLTASSVRSTVRSTRRWRRVAPTPRWGLLMTSRQFCLKGIMSVADARRAVDIGATAIMVSNHGGRQLDGSRAPFDHLAEIGHAVGDRIDVVCYGCITRVTHRLKALSAGAEAYSAG